METPPGLREGNGTTRRRALTGGEGGPHGYVLGHLRDRGRAAGDHRLAAPPPRRRNRPAALPRVRHGPPRLRPLLPPLRPGDGEVAITPSPLYSGVRAGVRGFDCNRSVG